MASSGFAKSPTTTRALGSSGFRVLWFWGLGLRVRGLGFRV